jgi:glycosyltransferase involved in cell wall biosynthesis
MKSARVCAVIPAYNEGETIAEVVEETKKYVDAVFAVDDGSTDDNCRGGQEGWGKGPHILQ